MIEVALPRTISLNERCTLLSHAICQIALLPPTGFSPLSLSLVRTHPSRQFVFISPSNNSVPPPRPTFTCSPQRILSNECNLFSGRSIFLVSPKETFPRGIYDTHRCKFRFKSGWMKIDKALISSIILERGKGVYRVYIRTKLIDNDFKRFIPS